MYQVRRPNNGKTAHLDSLARECGVLYSQTLVFFWRTVRHKGLWLKKNHLQRLFTSKNVHAHMADACVEAFCAALTSWRARRTSDPNAYPPRRRRYFRIEYKSSAMRLTDGNLTLSNGKDNAPLVLAWPWELPKTMVIHWTGKQYEAIATYKQEKAFVHPQGDNVAGIVLGEIHMTVSHDGEHTHILNGRHPRARRQYQNKLKEHLAKQIDRKQKGSRRRKQLQRSKQRQLTKLTNHIKDIEHKQTARLVSTMYQEGVQTVVIGNVRDIRQENDTGSTNNQRLHQWSCGRVRHKLTYKAKRLGMQVVLQDEHRTSRMCPACGTCRKSKPPRRVFCYTNNRCRWIWHRDGVGAINIRAKYRGECGSPPS